MAQINLNFKITSTKYRIITSQNPCPLDDNILGEHKKALKNQRPDLSAVCKHSITMDHIISWTEAKILELETDYPSKAGI